MDLLSTSIIHIKCNNSKHTIFCANTLLFEFILLKYECNVMIKNIVPSLPTYMELRKKLLFFSSISKYILYIKIIYLKLNLRKSHSDG